MRLSLFSLFNTSDTATSLLKDLGITSDDITECYLVNGDTTHMLNGQSIKELAREFETSTKTRASISRSSFSIRVLANKKAYTVQVSGNGSYLVYRGSVYEVTNNIVDMLAVSEPSRQAREILYASQVEDPRMWCTK